LNNNNPSTAKESHPDPSFGVPDYKKGDIVWAKVRGYSWWPAKVIT
jgi:hypothetical protein